MSSGSHLEVLNHVAATIRTMMKYNTLGSTGIEVSQLAFGAGPIPQVMIGDQNQRQLEVVKRALDAGINWFDTAATYGGGRSEECLGRALEQLSARSVHVATKVRLMPEHLGDIEGAVQVSLQNSLKRLRRERVSLLQLHNSITADRGDEPTSITPSDVLGRVLSAMTALREQGLVAHLGITGIGQPPALREVIRSDAFATMQVPYHLLNPSAGRGMSDAFGETNYGNAIAACNAQNMGVFAIRVFAGGALLNRDPSPHTYKTKFFPLELYERDRDRARQIARQVGGGMDAGELGVRFVLSHPQITSAIIGFGDALHVDHAVAAAEKGPLDDEFATLGS